MVVLLDNSALYSPLTVCHLDRGCTIRLPICIGIDLIACVNAGEDKSLKRLR